MRLEPCQWDIACVLTDGRVTLQDLFSGLWPTFAVVLLVLAGVFAIMALLFDEIEAEQTRRKLAGRRARQTTEDTRDRSQEAKSHSRIRRPTHTRMRAS